MRRGMFGALVLVSTLGLSGCSAVILGTLANAGTDKATLRKSTAEYFNVRQESVQIGNIKNGALGASYKARVKGVLYNCGVSYGAVDCKRPGA